MIEKDGWMWTWSYKKCEYVKFCPVEEWQARTQMVKDIDAAPDDQKQAVLEAAQKQLRKMRNKRYK